MAQPLSLYAHIPFCTAKCGYCDFNSYANQDHLIPSYTDALVKEAQLWHKATESSLMKRFSTKIICRPTSRLSWFVLALSGCGPTLLG